MHGLYVTLKQLTMSLDILSNLYSYLLIFAGSMVVRRIRASTPTLDGVIRYYNIARKFA